MSDPPQMDDGDAWVEATDDNTGRKFYANVNTGEAVWEMPLSVKLKREKEGKVEYWELFDEQRNLPYYYNTLTGSTEWVLPAGVVPVKIHKKSEGPNPVPPASSEEPPASLNEPTSDIKIPNENLANGHTSSTTPETTDGDPSDQKEEPNKTVTPRDEEKTTPPLQDDGTKKEEEFKSFLDSTSRYPMRRHKESAQTVSYPHGPPPSIVSLLENSKNVAEKPSTLPHHRPTSALPPLPTPQSPLPPLPGLPPLPSLPKTAVSSDSVPVRAKPLPQLPDTPLPSPPSQHQQHPQHPALTKPLPSRPPPGAPAVPPSNSGGSSSPRLGNTPRTISSPQLQRSKDNIDLAKVALAGRPMLGSPVPDRPDLQKMTRVISQLHLPSPQKTALEESVKERRASTMGIGSPESSRGKEKGKEKEKEKEKDEKKEKKRKPTKVSSIRFGLLNMKSKKVVGPEGQKILTRDILVEINKFQLEDYAKKFFTSRKKGIFRRQVPVKEMIMFEKRPIAGPLLKTQKPELVKDAIKIFKKILMYQGIMESEEPDPIVIAREIVSEGIRDGQLRDEIYCQICKQTCYTPTEELLYKGWELMIFSCLTFPPTQNFEEWLRKYIGEHTKSDTKESAYAKFCLKKLDLTCRAGPRGRIPSLVELRLIRDAPFVGSPFGADFDEIMAQQKDTHPNLAVPLILVTLCDAVLNLGGMNIEGIFRIPADMEPLYDLKAEIESGNYSIANVPNANTPASLLKLWLRELESPLIPQEFYAQCLASVNDPEESLRIVSLLPDINKRVLYYLVRFLQIVADPENQKKTKMTVNNLAMIFAPNFLRCVSDHPQTMINNAKIEQDYVKNLILHLETGDFLSSLSINLKA